MRRALLRLGPLLLALAVALVPAPALRAGAPPTVNEDAVKAAFIYNFALFVEWPGEADHTGPFVVGVLGDDAFADVLTAVTRGKTTNKHPVQVRRLTAVDDPRTCQLIFIGAAADKQGVVLRRARGFPVLTVGETVDFLHDGGIIRFVIENDQLRFQIHPAAAAASGLRIDPQLKRVALRPYEP
jgi:hypothetical protein